MLLYATVPGFYAEVERAAQPDLEARPVLVGGHPRKRGTGQAATEDARRAGVLVGMPVMEALALCPQARALRTNMRLYRETSKRLFAHFRREAARVEAAGLDAAYLDLTGSDEDPAEVAARLRRSVAEALRLPLQVGAAPIKFVAKLAAEECEDEGVLWVEAGSVRSFLDPLGVDRLPGAGPRTVERLHGLSVRTVGAFAALARETIETELGNHGLMLHALAVGRDVARLRAAPHPRSMSQESTLAEPELEREILAERLAELTQDLERSLALERLAAKRIVLKVRYGDREATTRSRTVPHPLHRSDDLLRLAEQLLDRTQVGRRPVGRIGLALSGLVRVGGDDRQLDLFDES